MPKRHQLTAQTAKDIIAFIRSGAFPHVAAEAAGVPKETYEDWLRRGSLKKARDPYRSFYIQVRQASAQARLRAEVAALAEDPRLWLRSGPGKEKPDNPGWTAVVRPQLTQNNQTINLFMSPEFLQFMALLRSILAPYPEAMAALSTALEQQPKAITDETRQ